MDGKNMCENCGKEFASIVFTPNEAGAVEKHLCISCFENLNKKVDA